MKITVILGNVGDDSGIYHDVRLSLPDSVVSAYVIAEAALSQLLSMRDDDGEPYVLLRDDGSRPNYDLVGIYSGWIEHVRGVI